MFVVTLSVFCSPDSLVHSLNPHFPSLSPAATMFCQTKREVLFSSVLPASVVEEGIHSFFKVILVFIGALGQTVKLI